MSRRRRILKWLVAAAMIGGFGWWCLASSPYQSRYSRIASLLAGKPVRVHCEGRLRWAMARWDHGQLTAGELGFAEVGGKDAYLSPATCRELDRLIGKPQLPRGRAQLAAEQALLVLAHETMHLRGEANESAANCEAGQAALLEARAFGFAPADATALAAFIRSDLEQNSFDQPDIYQVASDCFAR